MYTLYFLSSLQECSPGEANAFNGRLIDEPAASVSRGFVDEGAGQSRARVKDFLHDCALAGAGGDESNADGVCNDGKGQGDSLRRRLGRIFNWCDPGVGFAQQLVVGEEGAGVAVGSAAEQEEVEDGQAHRVARSKAAD